MASGRRHFLAGSLAVGAAWLAPRAAAAPPGPPEPAAPTERPGSGPRFRVAADGWGAASLPEVEAVLRSAAAPLWKYFPERSLEPIVVVRGREGPIVHYQRNVVGEIVMKLDTQDYLWCQYVYQFAHEFCHILCGYRDQPWKGHNWFEETLCEMASLFVLRRLSATWEAAPPYPAWRAYAPEFRRYAQTVMDSRSQVGGGHLGDLYQQHRRDLERTPSDRHLTGAMALTLLGLVEGAPESWESLAWLNTQNAPEGEPFPAYLARWRDAVPGRHRGFVDEVARQFGVARNAGPRAHSAD